MVKYVIRINSPSGKNESVLDYYPETPKEQYEFDNELTAYKSTLNWQRLISKDKNIYAYVFVKEKEY